MRTIHVCLALSTPALLLATACGPTGPEPADHYLQASITGSLDSEYIGTGEFRLGTPPGGGLTHVGIASEGTGASAGETFRVDHRADGRIATGTHPITLLDRRDRDAPGTGATYAVTRDGEERRFVAGSGSLVITSSVPERVEGSFSMDAFLYCVRSDDPADRTNCPVPSEADPDAPSIRVTGDFVAAFRRDTVIAL